MHDPSLYDLMHGNQNNIKKKVLDKNPTNKKNDPFEIALEENIQHQVDELMKEQDLHELKLLNPAGIRAKLEQEVRQSLDQSEFEQHIAKAVNILETEGNRYFSSEEEMVLNEDLNNLRNRLNTMEFAQTGNVNFDDIYKISTESMDSILRVAIAKFDEGLLEDSLALFTFLSLLDGKNADYAYRLGIISQKNQRYDLALMAYKNASELDSNMIAPHYFAAECYLVFDKKDEALKELTEAKNILKIGNQEEWNDLIADMERQLSSAA